MLTPDQESALREAAARLSAAADKAASDASSTNSWWAKLIGADSAASAAASSAAATRNLANTMAAKAEAIISAGDDSQVPPFLADCGRYVDVSDISAQTSGLTILGAVKDVGGATLKDLGSGLAKIGSVLTSPWTLGGIVVVVVAGTVSFYLYEKSGR